MRGWKNDTHFLGGYFGWKTDGYKRFYRWNKRERKSYKPLKKKIFDSMLLQMRSLTEAVFQINPSNAERGMHSLNFNIGTAYYTDDNPVLYEKLI